ncbi:MAG: L,D-transpeptidase family protein [Spongiibacteraceae bacterium]
MHRRTLSLPFFSFLLSFLCVFDIHATALDATRTIDHRAVANTIQQILATQHIPNVDGDAASTTIGRLTLDQGVAQFYQKRHYEPAWIDPANITQLIREIENIRDDGLNPEDYSLSPLRERFAQLIATETVSSEERAQFDLLATRAYLRSLGHLFRGKINPATLEPQWNFPRNDMMVHEALEMESEGIERHTLAGVYERMRPQHIIYERARAALKNFRAISAAGGWPKIQTDIVLKPGMTDPQIAILRQRLLGNDANSRIENPELYDNALVSAVKKFQREQYLSADGIIGAATLAALNVPIQTRIDQLRVNLERGRWLLHDLQGDFVLVDIAGYKIYFYKQGKVVWESIVQVGKPARSTPSFRAKATYITFNPKWTVPPTILKKDILPKVKKNAGYLAQNNIRVFDSNDRELDPKTIDWNRPGNIVLRQDAGGDDAALGKVVIRFPNPYSIFLHDTPHRDLFSNDQRAFSSGCIRVERPLELVELLFNDSEKWNRAAIEKLIDTGETKNVNLPKPVPLLLAYWTVDLFADGAVGFKPDIYKRDEPLLKSLNSTW